MALLAWPLGAAGPRTPGAAEAWTLPLFTADPRTVLAAASKYAVSEDLNAFTIDYSVQVQIDSAGKLTKTTRSVTRVQRVPGIDGARRVSVAWAEWRENRPKIKARVITRDAVPHMLDEPSIEETSATQGSADAPGIKVLTAVLPAVDLDCVVELEIQESDREPGFPGARLGQVIPEAAFPIGHFKVSVRSPSPVRVEQHGFPESARVASQSMGAQGLDTVEASNLFPGFTGTLLPPEVAPRPTVTFTNVANWQSLARWYSDIVQKAAAAPASTPHSTPQATAAGGDQLSTIENIFEDLRKKVHDTGVPLGAAPYTPRSAAETLQKTSGNSEDEAVVLISKLAEAGIPAMAALISAEPHPDVVPNLPGLEAFNRMLVYVGGTHPLWIDASAEFTPVSRLPLADQGRWALILDPATTDLVRTPASTAADNSQTISMEIRLEDGADTRIAQTLEASGAFEDLLRALANSVNSADAEEKQNAQSQLLRIAGAERITKTEMGDPHKLLTPARIELTAEGYRASQVGDDGGFIDLPGQISANLQRITAALRSAVTGAGAAGAARKFDYFLPPAFTEQRRYHVIPPPGYRFAEAPKLASLTLGPLQLSATAKLEPDGSLRAEYTLVSPKARYTAQEVAAFGRDLSKVAGQQTLRVTFFNSAEEKLASGDFKEAIGSFRERAAASPGDTNVRLRLAAAYLTAGARPAAIKLVTDILVKDPNNAAAYARLGWIYTHDEFGRPFRPGMNLAEAEKAYLKALDIDSKPSYGIELATLYTYNSEGIRFGKSARLDDAIRAYRQAGFDALARAGVINDYALTLLFAKKYSDLRQFFLYPQADRADPAFKLAAIAATTGESEAKDEADYAYPDSSKRKIALIEAARFLLTASAFEPAAMLFNLAGPGQGISASELALVRKAKPFDASAASSQPAIAAFQRFVSAVLNPADADAWKKYAGPELRDVSANRVRIALFQLLAGKQDPIYQPSSWPSLSDLSATALDFSADGNGATDFRIRVSDPARKGSEKNVAYVGKRGNEYLVLALAGDASGSGEALSKAQNGDLPGARQWLDWAKDELPMIKVADPLAAPAFQRLWPPKSNDPALIQAAAASIAVRGTSYERGLKALNEVRPQISDPELQTIIDQALLQGLIAHQRGAEAIPVIDRLQTKSPDSKLLTNYRAQALTAAHRYSEASTAIDAIERAEPGTLAGMRLRERLLVEQGKFQEAAVLQTQICANAQASGFDWNDLAWLGLFAHSDDKSMQQAADKAAELAGRRPDVLHTLALVQATTGLLKDARANGYRLMEVGAGSDQPLTIFGRLAEQLDLSNVAADYYKRIPKPDGDATLSTYAYAQMRLKAIAAAPAGKLNSQ